MWARTIDQNADYLKVISNSKVNLYYLYIDWNRNIVVLESNRCSRRESKQFGMGIARTRWKGNFTTAMILTDDFQVCFFLSVETSLRKIIYSYEAFCTTTRFETHAQGKLEMAYWVCTSRSFFQIFQDWQHSSQLRGCVGNSDAAQTAVLSS